MDVIRQNLRFATIPAVGAQMVARFLHAWDDTCSWSIAPAPVRAIFERLAECQGFKFGKNTFKSCCPHHLHKNEGMLREKPTIQQRNGIATKP